MTFIPWLLIFEICNSKSIPIDEIFFFKASATSFAVFNPWVNANTEGPEPEIPNHMAPASFEAFLRFSKFGINKERMGSTIPSFKLRDISS